MDNQNREMEQQLATAILADIMRIENERERQEQQNSDTEETLTEDSENETNNDYTLQQTGPINLSTTTISIPSPRDQNPPEPEEDREEQSDARHQPSSERQDEMYSSHTMFVPVNRMLTYPDPRDSAGSPASPSPGPRQENEDQNPQLNGTDEQDNQEITLTLTHEVLEQHNATSTPRLPRAISIRRPPTPQVPNTSPIQRQSSAPRIMTMAMAKKRKMFDQTCGPHPANAYAKYWNDIATCPVCGDLPRLGPIYTCPQGHLFCQECREKVKICPICRDPLLKNRSRISEYIIEKYLKDQYTACRNNERGCKKKGTLRELCDHEVICPFTEVTCPGKILGCTWQGARISLPNHINTKTSCVDKIESVDRWMHWNKRRSERYTNVIRDFGLQEETIFLRKLDVTWKPILHNSNKTNPLWTYLIVTRKSNGVWTLQIKGYMSPELALKMRARITLTSAETSVPNNGNTDNIICPNYTGAITSHWTSDTDAFNMGRYLTVSDITIAQLRHPTIVTKLFNYTVEIQHTDEIEQILRKENEGLAPERPKPKWNPLQDSSRNL